MRKMRLILIPLFLLVTAADLFAQTGYNWPCVPFDQPHWINGTFCENRPGGEIQRDHFHDAVDIHLPQGSNVYSVISGTVTSLSTAAQSGINAYVRVGRYAYVHGDPQPGLQVGDAVTAFQTVIGKTNSWNHIHFKDGYSGSEINALRQSGGLTPFNDSFNPSVQWVRFYVDGTTTRFTNNKVSGKVEIVARASDVTDNGPLGGNNGIFTIGYQIFDSTGTVALTPVVQNFIFDVIPASDSYITNVYFSGSDISTYLYTLTNKVTQKSFWNTAGFEPGKYKILVFTEDTYANRDEAWTTVEVVPQDIWPPEIPQLLYALGNDSGDWELAWLPNDSLDMAGYDFYFSFDGTNWNYQSGISAQLGPQDTLWLQNNFPENTSIYFRLQAYDNSALQNSSDFSSSYGVRLKSSGPEVLIVDAVNPGEVARQDVAFDYGEIFGGLDLSFNTASVAALESDRIDLQDYTVVICFAGGTSPQFGDSALTKLQTYLQAGGNLILTGSRVAGTLAAGSTAERQFLGDYLHAARSDSAAANTVSGVVATFLEEFSGALPGGDYYDVLTPLGGEAVLQYSENAIAAIFYEGLFGSGSVTGRTALLAFPAEQLAGENENTELIGRLLGRMGLVSGLQVESRTGGPRNYRLYQNYPNPFNPSTRIGFFLPQANAVKMQIIDVNGQKVAELVNRRLSAGEHFVRWNGTDDQSRFVGSGLYFVRLQAGKFNRTRKIILLR